MERVEESQRERDEFQAGAASASSLAKEQRETVVV
jgi:hypothetical protein